MIIIFRISKLTVSCSVIQQYAGLYGWTFFDETVNPLQASLLLRTGSFHLHLSNWFELNLLWHNSVVSQIKHVLAVLRQLISVKLYPASCFLKYYVCCLVKSWWFLFQSVRYSYLNLLDFDKWFLIFGYENWWHQEIVWLAYRYGFVKYQKSTFYPINNIMKNIWRKEKNIRNQKITN